MRSQESPSGIVSYGLTIYQAGMETRHLKRKENYSRLLYSKIILSWKQWKSSNFGKDFPGLF